MTLSVPPHIQKAGVVDNQFLFPWDEWNLRPYYDHDANNWYERLEPLSIRAQLALTMAAGEWVLHRFSSAVRDAEPMQMLEAGWAGTINPAYIQIPEPDEENWRGPARGPVYILMLIVADSFNHLEEDADGATRAVWMFNLAHHVLPRTTAFDAWFEEVVGRLESGDYRKPPPEEEDLFGGLPTGMGIPVPREAFDLSLPYDPADGPALLDGFLRQLDWERNPFLLPPDQVAESDIFEGTPYRYP